MSVAVYYAREGNRNYIERCEFPDGTVREWDKSKGKICLEKCKEYIGDKVEVHYPISENEEVVKKGYIKDYYVKNNGHHSLKISCTSKKSENFVE